MYVQQRTSWLADFTFFIIFAIFSFNLAKAQWTKNIFHSVGIDYSYFFSPIKNIYKEEYNEQTGLYTYTPAYFGDYEVFETQYIVGYNFKPINIGLGLNSYGLYHKYNFLGFNYNLFLSLSYSKKIVIDFQWYYRLRRLDNFPKFELGYVFKDVWLKTDVITFLIIHLYEFDKWFIGGAIQIKLYNALKK